MFSHFLCPVNDLHTNGFKHRPAESELLEGKSYIIGLLCEVLGNYNTKCLVQSLNRLGRRGDVRDDSAEILFQFFLQEAFVSSSGIGSDVRSLMLSI